MPKLSVEIAGIEDLQKALEKIGTADKVQKVVRHYGGRLQTNSMKRASKSGVFIKGYSTGNIRRDLQKGLKIIDSGYTAELTSDTDYSVYVERGTRFMQAEPYMKPSVKELEKEFIKAVEDTLKR